MQEIETLAQFAVQYADEGAMIGGTLATLYGAYRQGKRKKVKELSNQLETQVRATLDEAGIFQPQVSELEISDVNEAINEIRAEWERTHSDGTYYATTEQDYRKIAERIGLISNLPYRYSRFDCENYARLFQSLVALTYGINAVGIVTDYAAAHAYNVFVTMDGKTMFYDPQTGNFVEPGDTETFGDRQREYLKEDGGGRFLF